MRNACDSDSPCGLACDASARDAKSLAMRVERCEPLQRQKSSQKVSRPFFDISWQASRSTSFPALLGGLWCSHPIRVLHGVASMKWRSGPRFQTKSAWGSLRGMVPLNFSSYTHSTYIWCVTAQAFCSQKSFSEITPKLRSITLNYAKSR